MNMDMSVLMMMIGIRLYSIFIRCVNHINFIASSIDNNSMINLQFDSQDMRATAGCGRPKVAPT